jgi:hypothetical protein
MKIEVQDIFQQYGADFFSRYKPSQEQLKVFRAILQCRTAELGCHSDVCDVCGFEKISYNSCRNRHCPKCGTFEKEEWLDRQSESLLDCGYFHVVFTLPSELNSIVYQNQRIIYGLLFKAASETLLELCADKKYLGAKIGLTAVLHTWGQNLSYHPHLHCVVTGGGLTEINKWRYSCKKFLIPLRVLSKKFRSKFMALLRKTELQFFGRTAYLADPTNWFEFVKKLYKINWITYCKPPFGNAQKVLDYLGRYTHRVAISNNRIISCSDGKVAFKYRDCADGSKQKIMTLAATEFIRRFLIHVLPSGFRKIRHFGLLAPCGKFRRIRLCRRLTHTNFVPRHETAEQRLERIFGADFNLCPCCKIGHLTRASP